MLHLGNITCKTEPGTNGNVELTSPTMPLEQIATLFGVDLNFIKALTTQTVTVNKVSHDKILSPEETKNNINALIKWIYGAMFDWVVTKVNKAHGLIAKTQDKRLTKFVGILDIFGFEIGQKNTFEQLCINYTNERLQQQFNEIAFDAEQQEYKKEGLDWSNISFRDNKTVIDLIGKKPQGLLILLEEHSLMNRDPDDQALLNTYHKHHFNLHVNYAKPRFGQESFVVKHFAGDVEYYIENFITKNNDTLQNDLAMQFSLSKEKFIQDVLQVSTTKDTNKIASTVSVSLKFRNQLDDLMNFLRSTKAFYIKCIKPNGEKKAGVFNAPMVITQLRYSGVLEIVRIRREGFPTRVLYKDFYDEYKELAQVKKWPESSKLTEEQLKEHCKQLITQYVPAGSFQFGKRYLFLRHYVPQIMMAAI